jgi:hypothetical protein
MPEFGYSAVKIPGSKASPHAQKHQGASALIHACHQIRHEAHPIFYAQTTFDFGSLHFWTSALRKYGPYAYKPIRYVRVSEQTAAFMGIKNSRNYGVGLALSDTLNALHSLEQVEIVLEGVYPPDSPGMRLVGYCAKWHKGRRVESDRTW